MQIYKAYDTNIDGDCNDVCDISGNDYILLLQTCLKYCTCFSFRICGEKSEILFHKLPKELEKYRMPTKKNVLEAYRHYYPESSSFAENEIYCYHLCKATYDLLITISHSVFAWICNWEYENPEDIAFFRKDGSVFFRSIVHEGYCELCVKGTENVSHVTNKEIWHELPPK